MSQKDIKPGDPISAAWLNELNAAAKYLKNLRAAPPLEVSHTGAGPVIRFTRKLEARDPGFWAQILEPDEGYQRGKYAFHEIRRMGDGLGSWQTWDGARVGYANPEDVPVGEDEEPVTPANHSGYALHTQHFRFTPYGEVVFMRPFTTGSNGGDGSNASRLIYLFEREVVVEGLTTGFSIESGGSLRVYHCNGTDINNRPVEVEGDNGLISFENPYRLGSNEFEFDGPEHGKDLYAVVKQIQFRWVLVQIGCEPNPSYFVSL